MGSPHLTIFIVARKGRRGATRNVIVSSYNHSQYGMQVIEQILPILRVAQSHPYLFRPRGGRPLLVPGSKGDKLDDEVFRFLLTCVSYSLDSGMRDSHVHFDNETVEDLTNNAVACQNGTTFIDISDLEHAGVSYCVIMAPSPYSNREPDYPVYSPLSLKEYVAIYEEVPERGEEEDDAPPAIDKEQYPGMYALEVHYRQKRARTWKMLDEASFKMLKVEDLFPVWSDLRECLASRGKVDLPEPAVAAEERSPRATTLCELSLDQVSNIMRDMPADQQNTLLDFPTTLQVELFERLVKNHGRHFIKDAFCLLPLSMGDITRLDLAYCSQITDAGLAAIAASDAARSRLEQFIISHNDNISSEAINTIAFSCPILTDLRASHCGKITAAKLSESAKALMSFSYGPKELALDVYVVFTIRSYSQSKPEQKRVFKFRRDWLYGKAALHFVLRQLQCLSPIWMPSFGHFSSPYGKFVVDDILNNLQTQADHLFGIFSIDEEKGVFNDVWALRRPVIGALHGYDDPAPGASFKTLVDADKNGAMFYNLSYDTVNGPESGSVIIDLSNESGYKYCFMATRGPALGSSSNVVPMKPLSAMEYFDCFFGNTDIGAQWSDGRSAGAKDELLQSSRQLAESISSKFELLTHDNLKSIWPSYV